MRSSIAENLRKFSKKLSRWADAMKEFTLEILTPSKKFFSGPVTSITVPGTKGEFQVLYNHAPIISTLDIGKIKITDTEGKEQIYADGGGMIEVQHNKVLLLVNSIENVSDIDAARAKKSLERAKERLAAKKEQIDFQRAELSLRRAVNRLKLTGSYHNN